MCLLGGLADPVVVSLTQTLEVVILVSALVSLLIIFSSLVIDRLDELVANRILLNKVVHLLDLLIVLGLLPLRLRDKHGQLLLRTVPLFVGRIGDFDYVCHILALVVQLLLKLPVDVVENNAFSAKTIYSLSKILIVRDSFVELLVRLIESVL